MPVSAGSHPRDDHQRVLDAAESAARDRRAIAAGIPARALMRVAGAAAAGEIARRYAGRLEGGVDVFAGPGNNGGDAWVVGSALSAAGVAVRMIVVGEPKSGGDAAAERALAPPAITRPPSAGEAALVIDGLLGTGSSGAPRGGIADAVEQIALRRARGATVVALDVPTGVDATTGAVARDGAGAVRADLTLTFGAIKRGLLIAREWCGRIVVLDIGLGPLSDADAAMPALVDAAYVRAHVPPISASAHKGTRRYLAIVAGGEGMAGAAMLAERAARTSGIGLVRFFVAPANVPVVQGAAYESLAAAWPTTDAEAAREIGEWADAVLIGPGLGASPAARAAIDRVLRVTRLPTVVDADALNAYAGRAGELGALLAGRPAIVTPHVAEFGRLVGQGAEDVLAARFDIGQALASTLGATVLLKGVPTVITTPAAKGEGGPAERLVSATGTPALAAGGSGDILAGIAATLLAQTGAPGASAACAAWAHGRAAEIACGGGTVRGRTLDDVLAALPSVWRLDDPAPPYPVLAELPAVGDSSAR